MGAHCAFDTASQARSRNIPPLHGLILLRRIQAILSSCLSGPDETEENAPDVETTTWLSVNSPGYNAGADKWRFNLERDPIVADISATNIGKNALARGGALKDDAYQVNSKGKPKKPTYKILQVIKFVPSSATSQGSLFDENRP
jgi:hypothetical protein